MKDDHVRVRVERFVGEEVYEYTFIVTDEMLCVLTDPQGYLGRMVRDRINELNDEAGVPRI